MKEYTHTEFEEFARMAFYKGREIARYDDKGDAIFKRPTFNGFLREIDTLPEPKCGCPKGICIGHVDTNKSEIFLKLIEILVIKQGVDENDITLDAYLKNDLGLDSLDVYDLIMEIEKEYEIRVEDDLWDNLQKFTVRQVLNYIEKEKQ